MKYKAKSKSDEEVTKAKRMETEEGIVNDRLTLKYRLPTQLPLTILLQIFKIQLTYSPLKLKELL